MSAAEIARGKAIAESGKHTPPPQQWALDELRYWFGPLDNVVDLDAHRRREAATDG